MTHFLPLIRPTRVRLYLLLLQSMFLVLYGFHLVSPISRVQVWLCVVLATFTLLASHHPPCPTSRRRGLSALSP